MADRSISVNLRLKLTEWQSGWARASQTVKQSTDGISKSVKKNKADLDGMARGFTTVGLVAGAGIAIAVKKFADFDKAMSNIKAATHESAGNMALLRDAAIEAGAKTAFSATQAAGAIENLAKAGVSTQDILGGGLQGALDLAAAGEIDVAQAAETAATAMTQFKLSGKDVPHIADLLAAGAGKAQGEVGDLAQALNQSGLVASQFGLSIEETVGTLSAFASAGLLGSDAGTSFKTMLLRLANPSEEAASTLDDLGIHLHDAQGAFIGIAPLAEQLRAKLSKLTPAQRDAALATVFGSDAIRAANVLYQNGAKGITDWTNKVNDAGYAAETAATKQDNLRGDLEKLGGSFETLLIKIGAGGNGPFRSLVQGATELVDGLGKLPPAAQSTALAIASITAVAGLAGGGTLKAVTAANNLRAAWANLGRAGKALTLSAGGIGLALGAAAALYGAFAKSNEEAKQHAQSLRETLDQATGAITQNTRAFVANDLATKGFAQQAKDLGINLSDLTSAALGNHGALDSVTGSLDALIEAGKINGPVTDDATYKLYQNGIAARGLKDQLFGTNKELTEQQIKARLAAEGTQEHKSAQVQATEAIAKANEQIRTEKQNLDELIESMHLASSAALTLSGAQISYQQALSDANAAADKNGKTLDIATEKGRANRSALNGLAKATNDQSDAMLKAGRSQVSVAKTAETARVSFSGIAQQMGLSKKQADALARSLIDIPNVSRRAKIEANKADLDKKLADVRRQLKDPNLTKTRRAKLEAEKSQLEAAIRAAKAQLASLPGSKTVTIRSKFITERVTKNQTVTVTGGHAINADGGFYPGGMFGDYPFKSFAGGKLPGEATVEPGRGGGLVQWAEGETGGEAFIPLAPAKRRRSEAILSDVADAFGMRLERYADGGIRGASVTTTASRLELRQLTASFKALQKSLDRNAKATETTADRIRGLVQARNELSSAATSSFTGALFGSGTSTSDLKLRLQARTNDAKGLKTSLATLKKKGLNGSLFKELAASSDYQAASELAAMTPAQLKAINSAYAAQQRSVAALGSYAGNAVYGAAIKGQLSQYQKEEADIRTIRKAMQGVKVQIVKQGGSSYLQSVSGS